jgi:radical SAM superfamily enzyme YgiQ (UPF0313 family)
MKVLLISANRLTSPYPVYPLGLDYVAGAIADKHQTRICDLLAVTRAELDQIIEEFAPEVVGVSCRNIDNTDYAAPVSFLAGYKELVVWLRGRTRAVIVLGGCGFTIMPEVFLGAIGADFGIIGVGERFALFLDALAAGCDPATLAGVISSTSKAVVPAPLSAVARRRFATDGVHHHYYLRHGGMLNLQTKRGCVFRCSYCSYPRIEGGRHRLFDPAAVASEAKYLEEAGAKYLFFTDSAFNSDIEHSLAVARALQKEKLTIPWGAFFAPLPLPADYFAVMRTTGCKHVEFGSESLSDAMLHSYRKPFAAVDVFAAHEQARAAGLHVAHYFLFGGVGESRQTVTATLDNLDKLKTTVFFLFTGVRIYPGTAVHEAAVLDGQIDAADDLAEPVFYRPKAISLAEIGALIGQRAAGKSNWLFGSGSSEEQIAAKLYARGFTGPLWEFLTK